MPQPLSPSAPCQAQLSSSNKHPCIPGPCAPLPLANRRRMQGPSRFKRDGPCSFLLGIICPGYCHHSTAYRATNASGVYGGAGIGIVPLPLLRTASAPTLPGAGGCVAGVAYLTLMVHVPVTASGVANEH